jgi:hypothetical protein
MAKKILKKFLKWTGITLLLIIIALILIPIFFKDQLKEVVIAEVNKSLNAKLSLEDFDLTFISTFPNMTVVLNGAKLQGVKDFKDVTLVDIKELRAHVGFWDVVSGDQVAIKSIEVIDPIIDVRVLQDGAANYDIVKPDSMKTTEEIEEPSSFKLSLQDYSIKNGQIAYSDGASDMHATLKNLNHSGKGDLTADIIDFATTTSIEELSYDMEGVSYLSTVKTNADINLLMEFTDKSSKFTLKENKIDLNSMSFSIDGFYNMLETHDDMDLTLDTKETKFKDLLSLIPTFYHSGYESMVSNGNLKINALVKGQLDDKRLPGWDFGMILKNGSVNYPDLPGKISNIQMDAGSKFPGGENLNLMTADVNSFHANFGKNSIDGNLALRSMMTDPFIQSKILANVDLSTMKDFVPLAEGENYDGILDADVEVKGKMSDLDKGDYEAFTAKGDLTISDMLYASKDLPDDVNIEKIGFNFSPEQMSLTEMDAKIGKSDLSADGKIENYFGYLLRDDKLKGAFNVSSNYLDLDALMPASETPVPTEKAATPAPVAASDEYILIPNNIDFELNTDIKKARYNGIDISNIKGAVGLNNEVASMKNVTLNAMGGTVGLDGNYNTQDHANPKVDFAYKLKDIDINELATNFITVEKLAPITKYARGKISSNFDMKTGITPDFAPILTSISCLGSLKSNSIKLEGFELFDKIADKTKLKQFKNQTMKNFNTTFSVKDGKVELKPFDMKVGSITSKVSGYTGLDKKMNYTMALNVPKDQIPAEMIKVVENAMSKLQALSPKLNIGSLPDFIPVNVNVAGLYKNPTITSDFKEQILKSTGNFKDDLINSVKETIKDTVTTIINNKVDEVKEDFNAKKKEILDKAQIEANKAKAAAKKAADVVRAEAYKQAAQLMTEAGNNPIKKKAAEIAGKKLKSEAEKKTVKIEQEGNKKADQIMAKAQEQADRVGK